MTNEVSVSCIDIQQYDVINSEIALGDPFLECRNKYDTRMKDKNYNLSKLIVNINFNSIDNNCLYTLINNQIFLFYFYYHAEWIVGGEIIESWMNSTICITTIYYIDLYANQFIWKRFYFMITHRWRLYWTHKEFLKYSKKLVMRRPCCKIKLLCTASQDYDCIITVLIYRMSILKLY